MSRPRNAVPSYRRLNRKCGSPLAFVDIGGHRHYLGPYGSGESREAYRRLLAEIQACGAADAPILDRAPELTLIELAAHYLRFAGKHYVKNGRRTAEYTNIAAALKPLLDLYGTCEAAKFGPRALKAFQQHMITQRHTRQHINRCVGLIKRMFKWAVSEELLPGSTHHALQTVSALKRGRCEAPDTNPVTPVAEELIGPVQRHVPRQVAAMIELQLLTGMRPGEVVLMRQRDIDRSTAVWVYRPSEHKTEHHDRERVIMLGPKAQAVIEPFLARRSAEAYLFSPAEADRERRTAMHAERKTPLSCGNRPGSNVRDVIERCPGEFYTTHSYRRAIARGCDHAFPPPEHLQPRLLPTGRRETREAFLKRLTPEQKSELARWRSEHRWHPHQLRHTCATRIRREHGLEAAQILLGHSKADVTQIYAERDMQKAIAVAAQVG